MASIKLKHASGNSTILNSPAANPSSDVTLKLPSTTGSAGQVLKVASANHSSTNAELEFAADAGGKILQIVQGTSTTEDSFTTASFVASSLSATITPTAASSKILINSSFLVDTKASGRQIQVALYRSINGGTFTNISGGSNNAAIGSYNAGERLIEKASIIRLDTPSYSVGNSIVYKLYGKSESAAGLVTITGQGVEDVMILQEVAA